MVKGISAGSVPDRSFFPATSSPITVPPTSISLSSLHFNLVAATIWISFKTIVWGFWGGGWGSGGGGSVKRGRGAE